jgi:putative nucleotidyltransferase with HDIG domain
METFRVHALTTQHAADRIHRATGTGERDRVLVAALLHDVGKLVLEHTDERSAKVLRVPGAPELRTALERKWLGVDHARAGAEALRELGLSDRLTYAIERHHSEDARAESAVIRLADMLANYAGGLAVDGHHLATAGQAVGFDKETLRTVLERLPTFDDRVRSLEPSPLTNRQREMVRLLGEGKLYKEIANELGLSPSTVRSHLHLVYKKLHVADRAQAVLLAAERGWINGGTERPRATSPSA